MRAHLPHWAGLIHIVRRARRIFNLDTDTTAVAEGLGNDPLIGPAIRSRPGLRPLGAWDPFEVGVRAILGQQVSVAGASTLAARIVERHGVEVDGLSALGLSHVFPSAETLRGADLAGLGLTTSRDEQSARLRRLWSTGRFTSIAALVWTS